MAPFYWMPPQLCWVYPQRYDLMQPPPGQQAPRLSCVNKKYTIVRDNDGRWKFKTPLPELTGPNGLKQVHRRDFVATVCHYFFTHVLPANPHCIPSVEWFAGCIARHTWYIQRKRMLHTQLVERDENGNVTKRHAKKSHLWKPDAVTGEHNEMFYGALLVLYRVFSKSARGVPWENNERVLKVHFVAAFTLAFGYCGDDEVSDDHVRLTFFPELVESGHPGQDMALQDDRESLNGIEWGMFEDVGYELLFLKNATADRFLAWVGGEVRGAVELAGSVDGYARNPPNGWVRPTVWEYARQVQLRSGWCNQPPPTPLPPPDRPRGLRTHALDIQRSQLTSTTVIPLDGVVPSRPQGREDIWLRAGRCRWHPDYQGLYHPHFCDRCHPAATVPREVVEWVVGAVREGR